MIWCAHTPRKKQTREIKPPTSISHQHSLHSHSILIEIFRNILKSEKRLNFIFQFYADKTYHALCWNTTTTESGFSDGLVCTVHILQERSKWQRNIPLPCFPYIVTWSYPPHCNMWLLCPSDCIHKRDCTIVTKCTTTSCPLKGNADKTVVMFS